MACFTGKSLAFCIGGRITRLKDAVERQVDEAVLRSNLEILSMNRLQAFNIGEYQLTIFLIDRRIVSLFRDLDKEFGSNHWHLCNWKRSLEWLRCGLLNGAITLVQWQALTKFKIRKGSGL